MKKIFIVPEMAHKTIKVKAKCESNCGQESDFEEKEYKINCVYNPISFFPCCKKLNSFDFIKINSKLKPCQKIFYTLDNTEVDTSKNIFVDKIYFEKKLKKEKQKIKVRAKIFCEIDNKFSKEEFEKEYFISGAKVFGNENKILGFGNFVLGAKDE